MKDFRNFVEFVLHNCILVCGAEQVNLMLQVTNRKPRTLENFSLYACRSQLRAWPGGGDGGARSWTGSLLSTPRAADIGPGSEGGAEGHVAGLGVSFLRLLSPTLGLGRGRRWRGAHLDGATPNPTSGLVWRRQQRGAQLDGEFAFYASRHRLRAWPGASPEVGGGGVCSLSWTGSLLSTPLAADFGPGAEGAVEVSATGRGVCL